MLNSIIAKRIINKYSNCMEYYFDFIQGNEEEVFDQAIAIVKQAPLWAKVKMLILGEI